MTGGGTNRYRAAVRRLLSRLALGLLVVLAVIQLVPVERSNPPVARTVEVPEDVGAIFRRACWDCHSNETVWPWYSRVAPVSWLVAHDVHEGREELNFTQWDYPPPKRRKKLEEIDEVLGDAEMPLPIYLRVHPKAALSPAEIDLVQRWARAEAATIP